MTAAGQGLYAVPFGFRHADCFAPTGHHDQEAQAGHWNAVAFSLVHCSNGIGGWPVIRCTVSVV